MTGKGTAPMPLKCTIYPENISGILGPLCGRERSYFLMGKGEPTNRCSLETAEVFQTLLHSWLSTGLSILLMGKYEAPIIVYPKLRARPTGQGL